MNNLNNRSMWEKLGNLAGSILAYAVIGSFTALLVALTIKLIMLMF